MIRRLHVENLRNEDIGSEIDLSQSESHHARDVLRLEIGATVELFDNAGHCATGSIAQIKSKLITIRVDNITAATRSTSITIASAIPKGERADWMIEKLSELGIARFIPLITERSVVEAKGKNKLERWRRIAIESAKQSRRIGVMQIAEPAKLGEIVENCGHALALSTAADAVPIFNIPRAKKVELLIGPEGGWSESELALFIARKIIAVKLTDTILRIETAAVAAASIVCATRKEA